MLKKLTFEDGQITIPDEIREQYGLDHNEVILEQIIDSQQENTVGLLLHFVPPQINADDEHSTKVTRGLNALKALAGTGSPDVTDASVTIDDMLYGENSVFADQ